MRESELRNCLGAFNSCNHPTARREGGYCYWVGESRSQWADPEDKANTEGDENTLEEIQTLVTSPQVHEPINPPFCLSQFGLSFFGICSRPTLISTPLWALPKQTFQPLTCLIKESFLKVSFLTMCGVVETNPYFKVNSFNYDSSIH